MPVLVSCPPAPVAGIPDYNKLCGGIPVVDIRLLLNIVSVPLLQRRKLAGATRPLERGASLSSVMLGGGIEQIRFSGLHR